MRTRIYLIAGAVGLAAPSVGLVVGGSIGEALTVIGAAAVAVGGSVAVSHVAK